MSSAAMTALLIGNAGWGTWPALLASLVCALLVGVVNGVLVVNTGLPSFLVTLATFLVLQGTTLAGVRAVAGSGRVDGLDDAPGWSSAATLFGVDRAAGRRPVPRLAAVVAGRDRGGDLGAVAHQVRQRRLRQRRGAHRRPGARRAGAAHDRRAVLPQRHRGLADRRADPGPPGRACR